MRLLPLTHGLALMRYGLLGDGSGLRHIWGAGDPTRLATMSLGVVLAFAVVFTAISIKVFSREAVR